LIPGQSPPESCHPPPEPASHSPRMARAATKRRRRRVGPGALRRTPLAAAPALTVQRRCGTAASWHARDAGATRCCRGARRHHVDHLDGCFCVGSQSQSAREADLGSCQGLRARTSPAVCSLLLVREWCCGCCMRLRPAVPHQCFPVWLT
jgi:hypothetical protein